MDTIREDMREAGMEEEDALDGVRWRTMTRCGDLQRDKPKGEEDYHFLFHSLSNAVNVE